MKPTVSTHPLGLPFSHSFAALPDAFYTRLNPIPLPAPYLVAVSQSASRLIGIDPATFSQKEVVAAFGGNTVLPGAEPLAAVYSGHQFGEWAGQLGDGRAILLGEVPSAEGPLELQLKGSGLTPYSRMGDGRAVLRSSIREFLCSEAMVALGIPTSRALCLVGSDYAVQRETEETAAVVTRIAPTFVRFGSFEHWFYTGQHDELKTLADYVIDRHYSELREAENPYLALLTEVTRRTAHLVAQWQAIGFMHGVMNTDNMSILGLTIDYGPFGFMDGFDVRRICNESDHTGRYAYNQQPQVAHWNCFALGQALLPLIGDVDATQQALASFEPTFLAQFEHLLHAKLGLQTQQPDDNKLIDSMFLLLHENRADFTLFFRRLADIRLDDSGNDGKVRELFIDLAAIDVWMVQYRHRLHQENSQDGLRRITMQSVNPKFVLRNYLLQIAIEKAQNKDFSEIERLLKILERPFDEQPEHEAYAAFPPDWAQGLTVSCSS